MEATNPEHIIKKLFDENFHQLVLSAFKYIEDYDEAEEIVQDVFVKVWQNFDQLKKVKDPKSYLFKSVKNSSMNFIKHVKVRQKFVDSTINSNAGIENSIEEEQTITENSHKIHSAVNKLPENWKKAIVLSKYDNLKYYEIAEEMKISQKTVEKYISKALQVLRHELKDLFVLVFLIVDIFFRK